MSRPTDDLLVRLWGACISEGIGPRPELAGDRELVNQAAIRLGVSEHDRWNMALTDNHDRIICNKYGCVEVLGCATCGTAITLKWDGVWIEDAGSGPHEHQTGP